LTGIDEAVPSYAPELYLEIGFLPGKLPLRPWNPKKPYDFQIAHARDIPAGPILAV